MDNLLFYVLLKVFQSYQDDGKVKLKDCVKLNGLKGFHLQHFQPRKC